MADLSIEKRDAHDANEAPLDVKELFFSRTNGAGIIEAGNSVFQKISLYSWDELLGSPHKIIRHPDTPRAVFYLLWDYLKSGRPIAAYVKNRTKDGRYYWVMALAMPIEGGYLSVRLKPTSDLFETVKTLYASHVTYERSNSVRPEQSAAHLLETIKSHGFESYDDFMAQAISREIAARDAQLGTWVDPVLKLFEQMLETSKALVARSQSMLDLYDTYRHVPLNLRVMATQLGGEGNAIGVIAADYGKVSSEISDGVVSLGDSITKVIDEIRKGRFLMSASRLQEDLVQFFQTEADTDTQSIEILHLEALRLQHRTNAAAGLANMSLEVDQFQLKCLDLKRLSLGLEVIRIMAKLNAASLGSQSLTLSGLIVDLDSFQHEITAIIDHLQKINSELKVNIRLISQQLQGSSTVMSGSDRSNSVAA